MVNVVFVCPVQSVRGSGVRRGGASPQKGVPRSSLSPKKSLVPAPQVEPAWEDGPDNETISSKANGPGIFTIDYERNCQPNGWEPAAEFEDAGMDQAQVATYAVISISLGLGAWPITEQQYQVCPLALVAFCFRSCLSQTFSLLRRTLRLSKGLTRGSVSGKATTPVGCA